MAPAPRRTLFSVVRHRPFKGLKIVIFLLFLFWSLVLTFPLLLHLTDHIPQGSEGVGTVPLFNLWTLQWNIDQLRQGYPDYWNAPIFAPTSGTFAFSEIQMVSAWLAAPIWLATRSAALAYNVVVLLFLTLNGWFAFWFMCDRQVAPLPALLTGLMMQSLPFVAQEMGVLQLIAVFGFLWSLLYLNRLLGTDHHRRQNSLGLMLGLPVTFLTCGYYGSFSLLFLPVAALSLWNWQRRTARRLIWAVGVGLLSLSLVLPLLLAQKSILDAQHLTRRVETIQNNAARPTDYLKSLDTSLIYGRLLHIAFLPGQRLFPGLGLITLAVLGLFSGSGPQLIGQPRFKVYLVGAALLAFLLSFGPNLYLGQWHPYRLFSQIIPGFDQLRSPFRFAFFCQLHLALLAGLGISNLKSRISNLGLGLIGFVVIFEMLALPLPLQPMPDLLQQTAWQTWLRREPAARVIFLPFASSPSVADFEQTVNWMLSQPHWQGAMINGYSGFFPPGHADLRAKMLVFPTAEGVDLLRSKGVDYVVVAHGLPGAPNRESLTADLRLTFFDEAEQVGIYQLKSTE